MRLCCVLLLCCGCSSFTTTQTDLSYEDDQGRTIRLVQTRATARAVFEASAKLAAFKASQTDKTQTASVGSIEQQANSTNLTALLKAATALLKEVKAP